MEIKGMASSNEKKYLGLIVILSAMLRLIRLGTFPYWSDEVHNLLASEDIRGLIVEGHYAVNHPPLAYILLAIWRFMGMGINEWTVRGLPALFGVLGVLAVYWLGKTLFGARAGLFAALLLAVSPFHIVHAQDLKEYIYLPFFAALMAVFFYRGVAYNHGRDWFYYGVFAAICCYTEVFIVPLLLTINFWFLFLLPTYKDRFRKWFLSNVFGAVLFLPWLGRMLITSYTFAFTTDHWWIPKPNLWSLAFYFKAIAFGYSDLKPFFYLAFVMYGIVMVLGCHYAWRRSRLAASLMFSWTVAPVVIVFVLSFVMQSIFLLRAMLPYTIAVYVLAGIGLAELKFNRLRYATLACILCLSAIGLSAHYLRIMASEMYPHRPEVHPPFAYDKVAEYLLDNREEGDIIILGSMCAWLPLYWYGERELEHYVAGINDAYVQAMYAANPVVTDIEERLRIYPEVLESLVKGRKRIWYVFTEWERSLFQHHPFAVYRWLDSRFVEAGHKTFEGAYLYLYVTENHPNKPTVLKRDRDDGVSAMYTYGNPKTKYRKIRPDTGLIPKSHEERRGKITLAFKESSQESTASFDSLFISFEVLNESSEATHFDIQVVASDLLVQAASLDRFELSDNSWNYDKRYDAQPPHHAYDLWTLIGHFPNGASMVSGQAYVTEGVYIPVLHAVWPFGASAFNTAPVCIRIDHEKPFDFAVPAAEPPQWCWIAGAPLIVPATGNIPIWIEGRPLSVEQPGYVQIAYIGLVAKEKLDGPLPEPAAAPFWRIQGRQLQPRETATWTIAVPLRTGRVDVWALEYGPEGKGYHIFDLLAGEDASTSRLPLHVFEDE